ncbi:MAG: alpha/beta fold hydrolase [Actinomycetota bacterium]
MSVSIPTAFSNPEAAPIHAIGPLVVPAPDRPIDLHLRVTSPSTATSAPVVLLSHGHGPSNYVSSLHGYAPLVEYYAANGFVVIQPTHLDSATLGLRDADHPEAPLYWRSRALDMTTIVDNLDLIEQALPWIGGLDREQIAVIGHSMGGHTASLLLGARTTDPTTGAIVDLTDPRIRAGVLLAAPGRGGDAIKPAAAQMWPIFTTTDFSTMTTPALVVAGDHDSSSHLTTVGPAWFTDPHHLSPAPTTLLTLTNAEHGLGGVAGYDLAETTDEDPKRVNHVNQLSTAYLRTQLDPTNPAWRHAKETFTTNHQAIGNLTALP